MAGEISALAQRAVPAMKRDDTWDESEHFIADLRQRFHSRLPQRSRQLALRRVLVPSKQGPCRVLLEQLSLQASNGGAQTEWWLIAWDLDRIDVEFRQCSSRSELRKAAQEYPVGAVQRRRKVTVLRSR